MSDSTSAHYDRSGRWQRWQMEELGNAPASSHPDSALQLQQRKVLAAQKAAEAARQREADERQALLERWRREAEEAGHQTGFEQGREAGLTQGLAEGRAQARETLDEEIHKATAPLLALAKQFSAALERLDETLAHDLTELALATGRQLASEALHATPEHILDVVRALLHSEPPLVGQQRLWLNPEDHALVTQHLGDELKAAGWKLQPDAQLARGGCRVTSAQGELDATFESRWQAVRAQLPAPADSATPDAAE
ncbi:flagellar assembly protein FliH [Halomonas dongshanensis]|uniref:Flagellar assembly protein FliH n=1 Tax=Halomonas dongshanensis TaxID=2890835 RepID=A0ABT2EF73_9GAMM|nr:flagellar assembly protein FliH [Halomonas dongshanensis]MCS2610246.1 flagellar assembly protein FliH [Halomonas dongshanensis]